MASYIKISEDGAIKENVGVQSGISLKNNLSGRNRPKKPLGNLHNIIHNQLGRNPGQNGEIEKNKKEAAQFIKSNPKESCTIFNDEFDDFCSFKGNDKGLEEKWLENELANSKIFEKIIEADKPRTKPITKEELDWIEYYEFGDQAQHYCSKTLNFEERKVEIPEIEVLKPSWCDLDTICPPEPPSDLFDDLNLSDIENIVSSKNKMVELPKPIIASDFEDMNFLNDSFNS